LKHRPLLFSRTSTHIYRYSAKQIRPIISSFAVLVFVNSARFRRVGAGLVIVVLASRQAMTVNTHATAPVEAPSRKQIAAAAATAMVVTVVVLVATILPAEYGKDPLGPGKPSGCPT
jgi:hypothetical protein